MVTASTFSASSSTAMITDARGAPSADWTCIASPFVRCL